tara:strand:- start:9905 stop:10384 length:480 start_codon:yes stop_codon:yes gene_type:complete
MRTLPNTLIEKMNAAETDALVLALLTIRHADISTLRMVNDITGVTSNGDFYFPFPFSVVLPVESEEAVPALQVSVSNITRDVVQAARTVAGSTNGRPLGDVHIIDVADPDTWLASYTGFEIRAVSYDAETLSFELSVDSLLNKPFPSMTQTPHRVPGIF